MNTPNKAEIRITGFGGQGVILMGKILGTAAAIQHQRHATLIQAYGPETRGSACRVDLSMADQVIDYPYFSQPEMLVVLSQDGYAKFRGSLAPGGLLCYDQDLVELNAEDAALAALPESERPAGAVRLAPVPAMHFAEQAGNRIMTNMAMLGFFVALSHVIGQKELETVVSDMVPAHSVTANLGALRRGYEYGQEWLGKQAGQNGNGKCANGKCGAH